MTAEPLDADPALFRALFDAIDEGFCVCEMITDDQGTPVDYRFLMTNPRFEEMSGIADAVGRTALEAVPDLEKHWIDTYARVAFDGERLRFSQGSEAMGRYFDVFATRFGPPGRFAIVFRDITSVNEAAAKLARSEAEFRSLADTLPLVVWVHGPDGEQEFVNQTYCDYFGVTREQMHDSNWQMLTHPDDGTAYAEEFANAVAEQRAFHAEVRAQRADGRWRWLESWGTPRFDADGTYLGHVGASADVTTRKLAEKRLAQSAAFTARVLDNLFTFTAVLDLDGVLQSANKAPLDAAGLSAADVVGRPFWECWWWNYDRDVMERLQQAIAQARAGTPVRYDTDVRMEGDSVMTIDFQIAPLRDDDGEITHLVASGIDLTQRKAAEAAAASRLAAERSARRRAEILEAVAAAVAVAITVDDAARSIVDALHPDDGETFTVVLADAETLTIRATSRVPSDLAQAYERIPVGDDGPITTIYRRAQPVVFDTGDQFDEMFPDHRHVRAAMAFESTMALPIVSTMGAPLGVLIATSTEPHHYDHDRQSLLEAVTAQAGGSIERAMLHEAAERAREHEARARARAEVVTGVLTDIESADTVAEQTVRLVDALVPAIADFATVELPDRADPLVALRHHDPDLVVALATLRRRHRLRHDDAQSVARVARGEVHHMTGMDAAIRGEYAVDDDTRALLEQLAAHSYVAVPIGLGESTPGVLMVGLTDRDRRPYTDADVAFITEIADRAEAVITSTRLREQEHESSLRLQKALLPDRLADHPRIDVAARYEAAVASLQVGGDWYDTFVWDDGSYGIVVGDVVGHGVQAAAAMGRLRASAAMLIQEGEPEPLTMVDAIERCAAGPAGVDYATVFCAVVDPARSEIRYASAGHPPAIIVRAGTSPLRLDEALSAPICSLAGIERTTASQTLERDDVVVVYTDGLVETIDRPVQAGIDELCATVAGFGPADDIEQLNRTVIERVAGDGDDVVVVSLRYAPSIDRLRMRFPASRHELAPMRARLHQWLATQDIDDEQADRVVLATAEAAANVVEHAYAGVSAGVAADVSIRASHAHGSVTVIVSDAGTWNERERAAVNRGRGLSIIDAVTTSWHRVSGATGTALTMVFERGEVN